MIPTYKQLQLIKLAHRLNRYKPLLEQAQHLHNHNQSTALKKSTDIDLTGYLKSKEPPAPPTLQNIFNQLQAINEQLTEIKY